MAVLDNKPDNVRLAKFEDFINRDTGSRITGKKFIIKSFYSGKYEEYTIGSTLTKADVIPFINAGKCFVYINE